MQPESNNETSHRKRLDHVVEAHDVVDDFCNSIGAVADWVDRLSRNRLVHSPSSRGGFGRTRDPADHRSPTSRLGSNDHSRHGVILKSAPLVGLDFGND
jgi:hypothetical protein